MPAESSTRGGEGNRMVNYGVWMAGVIRGSSTRGLEIQNAVAAITLGLILILPPDTFLPARFRLFEAAPESIWGLSLIGIGAAQIAAALHDSIPLRRIAAAVLGVLFATIALGILFVNPFAALTPIMLTLACGQVGAFWQARWVR